jgi:hypothetical protein
MHSSAAWSAQLVLGVDPTRPFHPHDDRRVSFGLHRNIDLGIAHDVIIDVPKVKRRREQSPESVSTGHRTLGRTREQAKMASGLLGYVGLQSTGVGPEAYPPVGSFQRPLREPGERTPGAACAEVEVEAAVAPTSTPTAS